MEGKYILNSILEDLVLTVAYRHGITEEEAMKKVKAYLKKHNLLGNETKETGE